ncbi:MAG: hypothetical protein HRU20_19915 [Pseudomonadales bacterium]|nr:hypothetical protein [Pseudomonadales bacterium]
MNKNLVILASVFAVFCSSFVMSEEIIMIESTITGSQEQPKVISIVPWKASADPEYIGEELHGLGDPVNVFQSLDRVKFNRERLYIGSTRHIKGYKTLGP